MPVCAKCNCSFPTWLTIEGKQRNLHRRKYCLECSPFKGHNTKRLEDNQDSSQKKRYASKYVRYVRKKRILMKEKALEYKGGKCCICGYDKCSRALEFHHINPNEKAYPTSSSRISKMAWETLRAELDKCILVCANCHREIEEGLITYP